MRFFAKVTQCNSVRCPSRRGASRPSKKISVEKSLAVGGVPGGVPGTLPARSPRVKQLMMVLGKKLGNCYVKQLIHHGFWLCK